MSGHGELEPCPYCGGHANLSKIGRDWYRIAADHVTGCPLEDFELDCPQSDDQLPLLLRDWNTRVDRRPANCAEKCDQLKAEIAGLKTGYEAYEAQNAALKAEVEALRKTAPSSEVVWCACGDGHAANSYGAGFMAANNGVCENCDAATGKGERS
ncbi:hypothetical protein [Pseudomonas arsenicoxydans]|uniref:Restriction alleviation protein Lar n=1 Tax=Pseudomonas arsenicoxydans TaxID=702115 RepID=A0A4P6GIS0_9PSED|nr:hypothetical protein [Pseudomonas arsenicoxydans]QAY85381.1 hypothetical protein CUN61_15880 [Pseudomonas arsenicoxydans]